MQHERADIKPFINNAPLFAEVRLTSEVERTRRWANPAFDAPALDISDERTAQAGEPRGGHLNGRLPHHSV
jgi:hypothetical protein